MPLAPTVKVLPAAIGLSTDTAANWTSTNPVLPKAVPGYEEDTGKMKIGDGVTAWSLLPYFSNSAFTASYQAMLDNANQPDGVVVLDAQGKINATLIPDTLTGNIIYAADIAARDAVAVEDRTGIVVVIDASGDPTVSSGSAHYGWYNSAWVKLGEGESLDVSLTGYFNLTTNDLDDILDGTNFVKMTPAERTTLSELDTDAVRYTDSIFISGLNASQIATMNPA